MSLISAMTFVCEEFAASKRSMIEQKHLQAMFVSKEDDVPNSLL